jgi:hypothetical protein
VTPSSTATPLTCSSTNFKPVTIISNLNNTCFKNHTLPVNATLPTWGNTPWFNHTANHTWIGHHVISSDKFGGVVLTDQQRIAITFTSPCSAPPCSFTLTALTLCLKNLPPYFLAPGAVASVSFKVELGRYYTNVAPTLRRQLTFSSPAPHYAPYVDIQSTIWTPKIYVGPNVTCFTVPLTGLHYTLWAESALVAPGDFKLIITPYIHYDRSHASVHQSVLDCTPEQIEWVLASPLNCTEPSSYFSHGTGFLMPPGCPQNVNGQLVNGAGRRELANGARKLTNWYPDICVAGDPWHCLGFFPSIDLRGELPCPVVYGNPQVRNDTFTGRLTDPGLGLVPVRRQLHSVPTYNAVDCPASISNNGEFFIGADNIDYGRFLSGKSISTRYLLNTTGAFEVLLLFPAPCTRCNLYLKELWLPLASDCGGDVTFTATVGYWSNNFTIPDHGTDKVYPGSYFTSSGHPNDARTLVHLTQHLGSVSIILGDGWSDAKLEIPFTGGLQWIGVRLRANKCFKLGKGQDLDYFTPLCDGVVVTPTGLLRALRVGTNTVWDAVDETPGAFLPSAHVEPWIPFCTPYPSPSHGASPSNAATPTRTPSRSSTFSVGPLYRSGEILQPGFTGGQNGVDNGASGGSGSSVSGLSAGGIAGIVVGAVVAVVALAALSVFAVTKWRAAQDAAPPAAAARAGGAATAGAAAPRAAAPAAAAAGAAATAPAASSGAAPVVAAAVATAAPAAGAGTATGTSANNAEIKSPVRQRRPGFVSP